MILLKPIGILILSIFANTVLALTAEQIPIAHTPKIDGQCGYHDFPPPLLARCTESLAKGIPDMRGFWMQDDNLISFERIEQCGNRVVITGNGVIHDMRADGTGEHGVHDVLQAYLPHCFPIVVSAKFYQNTLGLYLFSWTPIVTRELLDNDHLKLIYRGKEHLLQKIDQIPKPLVHSKGINHIAP